MTIEPLTTPTADYGQIVNWISLSDSPVGMDAQHTHLMIITYLQQIAERLDKLESQLNATRG
jgi:hypothetical protein